MNALSPRSVLIKVIDLRAVADMTVDLRIPERLYAKYLDLTRRWLDLSGDEPHHRALSRAINAKQRGKAWLNCASHVVEADDLAEPTGNAGKFDHPRTTSTARI